MLLYPNGYVAFFEPNSDEYQRVRDEHWRQEVERQLAKKKQNLENAKAKAGGRSE